MSQSQFGSPVPSAKHCIVTFPEPNILLVELNRPKELNCVSLEGSEELDALWSWMDEEPSLTCGVITGKGRAFSAGADLKGTPPGTQSLLGSYNTLVTRSCR